MTLWEHVVCIVLYGAPLPFLTCFCIKSLRRGSQHCLAVGVFFVLILIGLPALIQQATVAWALPTTEGPRQFLGETFRNLSANTALTVALSWVLFCGSLFAGYYSLEAFGCGWRKGTYRIDLRKQKTLMVFCAIAVLILYLWAGLGQSFWERYEYLKFARTFARPEMSAFQASVFSLMVAAQLLAAIVAFGVPFKVNRHIKVALWCFIFVLALLLASRRALILPLVLTYLAAALYARRLYLPLLAAVGLAASFVLLFGKEIIGGFDAGFIAGQIKDAPEAMFRLAADLGVGHVASLATVQQIDLPMRFGVDHLWSVARKLPDGMLGIDLGLPERIVRLTTARFAGATEDDIPPGLLGQAWLDFRWAGGVVYGFVFGLALGGAERLVQLIIRSRWQVMLCVVVAFLLSMPLQTGSLDYLLGIETFFLVVMLGICFRLKKCISEQPTQPEIVEIQDGRGAEVLCASTRTKA